MPNYGDPTYWDKRYEKQEGKTFDWLEDFDSLRQLFEKMLKPSDRILNLGCGNSGEIIRAEREDVRRRVY